MMIEEKIAFTVDRFGKTEKDIVMYNELEEIPVPITGSTRNIIVIIASLVLVGCGSALLWKGKRQYY